MFRERCPVIGVSLHVRKRPERVEVLQPVPSLQVVGRVLARPRLNELHGGGQPVERRGHFLGVLLARTVTVGHDNDVRAPEVSCVSGGPFPCTSRVGGCNPASVLNGLHIPFPLRHVNSLSQGNGLNDAGQPVEGQRDAGALAPLRVASEAPFPPIRGRRATMLLSEVLGKGTDHTTYRPPVFVHVDVVGTGDGLGTVPVPVAGSPIGEQVPDVEPKRMDHRLRRASGVAMQERAPVPSRGHR